MLLRLTTLAAAALVAVSTAAFTPAPDVDWAMVAKIREEGLQRSRVMDFESFMTDVLSARLTQQNPDVLERTVIAPAPPPES